MAIRFPVNSFAQGAIEKHDGWSDEAKAAIEASEFHEMRGGGSARYSTTEEVAGEIAAWCEVEAARIANLKKDDEENTTELRHVGKRLAKAATRIQSYIEKGDQPDKPTAEEKAAAKAERAKAREAKKAEAGTRKSRKGKSKTKPAATDEEIAAGLDEAIAAAKGNKPKRPSYGVPETLAEDGEEVRLADEGEVVAAAG